MLRMDATAGEPIVPTAHPGIGLQRYDAEKVRRNFHDLMQNHRFEFWTAKLETPRPRHRGLLGQAERGVRLEDFQ